ncbi:MAG TPA: hypothetical protein VD694_08195 [Nitrososphaeraceae archaeon]|nr:hypothetical protein [Nitrososphaeraceae archaeon]
MKDDGQVKIKLREINEIVGEYLDRINNSIQQPKTFDELIEGLNGLIGPSTMTRNLQQSISFFFTFFVQPKYRGNKEAFSFSEDALDRLRHLVLQLDSLLSARFSESESSGGSGSVTVLEQMSQDLGDLKKTIEDLEAQTQGFTDRTSRYGANYPVDFIILSAHNTRKLAKRLEIDYKHLASLPKYNSKKNKDDIDDTTKLLRNLFSKFHHVVIALRNRHSKRTPFKINDEYDVQDLLYSLLLLHFDDIRTEEWTPGYAGGTARMDFLLKKEKLVIECKKPRKGLGTKEVGDQLIMDMARYRNHAECKILVCFVYDPGSIITNPKGLQDDIEAKSTSDFQIVVVIKP